jgi:ankyrin repeat protein
LHLAVIREMGDGSRLHIVDFLVQNGGAALLDKGTSDTGMTALHLCALTDRTEPLKLILRAGANPNLKDSRGFTPLQIAIQMNHRACQELVSVYRQFRIRYSVFDKSVSGKTLALEPIDKKIQRDQVKRLFAQNAFHRKSRLTFDLGTKATYFAMSAAYESRFKAGLLCTPPKGPKMTREAAAKYMKKYEAFVNKWIKQYSAVKKEMIDRIVAP